MSSKGKDPGALRTNAQKRNDASEGKGR
jgi:hypothetical protein